MCRARSVILGRMKCSNAFRRRALSVRASATLFAAAVASISSCRHLEPTPTGPDAVTRALRDKIDTSVVIYAENRAFDNLYGNFPGAHGLAEVMGADGRPLPSYLPQVDRDGSVLPTLPP